MTTSYSSDSISITVHFLYGSKPKKKYKHVEKKWFGGILGGHIGIEIDNNKILNFIPRGKFHVFARRRNKHSAFVIYSVKEFWEYYGSKLEDVKKTSIIIPVNEEQKKKLDLITKEYITQTPYDYAFFGMRCGSATYDILSQLNIFPHYSYRKTYLKIFYPRILRRKMLKKANENGWKVIRQGGTIRREWDKDDK